MKTTLMMLAMLGRLKGTRVLGGVSRLAEP